MAEVYKITSGTLLPTPPACIEIDMPNVKAMNNPLTPVHTIIAYPPSGTSWERETALPINRYAEIYFNATQFSTLKANVGVTPVYISYDAPAINGDDRISNQTVLLNYP